MCTKLSLEGKMIGAFLGDVICVPVSVDIQNTNVEIRYRVLCRSRCIFVLKNNATKDKYRIRLGTDNRWHTGKIKLPETGEYQVYVSNTNKDYVQYEIEFRQF